MYKCQTGLRATGEEIESYKRYSLVVGREAHRRRRYLIALSFS